MCLSKPKVPAPAPVIERQAYRDPAPRESLASTDPNMRRRLMGVMTSAQGVTDTASTTRQVFGGDQTMGVNIGGGSSPVTASPTAVMPTPTAGVQNGVSKTKLKSTFGKGSGIGVFGLAGRAAL